MGDFRFLSNILKMETTDAVFDAMKCNELKTYLKKHGQLTSGTKKELTRRAKGTFQFLLQRDADETVHSASNNPATEDASSLAKTQTATTGE